MVGAGLVGSFGWVGFGSVEVFVGTLVVVLVVGRVGCLG